MGRWYIQLGYAGKGMVHVLGGLEWDSAMFHHAPQGTAQFKTYELFIPGIFNLIFSDYSWLQVTKLWEKKPQIWGDYCRFDV